MKNSRFSLRVLFGLLCLCSVESVFCQSQQLSFEQWKAKQQQHDQRLKQQPKHTVQLQQRVVQVQPTQPVSYVATHTPQILGEQIKLNINTASQDEIVAKLEGIGRKKAQAVIDYRQQHGHFKRVDDLLQVKGIGQKTLDKNRDKIQINP
jgi:competence protein ComEA